MRAVRHFLSGIAVGAFVGVPWGLTVNPAPDWFFQLTYNPAFTGTLAVLVPTVIWVIDRTGQQR